MTSQLSSHRGRLPSWNRPGLSLKSGADVRKLTRDQLPPIALQTGHDVAGSKSLARIVQLEKNVMFLKQQHHETLGHLHKEIERLRNENRGVKCVLVCEISHLSPPFPPNLELNFKLVMCCCSKSRGGK